ncbi:MAG: 3-deoxy-D-manno-octulosonic acid transferase [Deltaproteobacteria bacterium]|nr:3-deoxy-D-manno-octulosonic acid transferase [Deltaproteobacteria bacterium]
MNIIYKAYNFLITGFFFVFSPPFWLYSRITGRYRDGIHQRLGFYPKSVVDRISGSPKIWLHAASVGEVSAAVAIIESLKRLIPHCAIILSTTTEHGQTSARDKLQSKATCVYAPIDFIVSVRKALSTIRPDILVCLETEIWPNWLFEARRMGVRLALVNGRISVRSIKGYLKIRCLIREALRQVESFSMIREADAQRLMMLGVPREKIVVNGNAKFDLLLPMADASIKGEIEKFYNLNGNIPVFVAGSTRGSEHEIVVDVYEKILETLPETLLIIAPRHLERVRYIKDMVIRRGFSCQFKTDIDKPGGFRTASVVIMDTIGDLQSTYSIASIVFCGGSLEPLGGQNILEAAVWGKPVLYGPSMDDFLDAKALLDKTGGGIQVKDGRELTERALYYLTHPAEADAVGRLAKEAVMLNKGAADNHADVICRLLNPNLS